MLIAFLSTYDLGHQPQLAAELIGTATDETIDPIDLALEELDDIEHRLARADAIICTAPMFTGASLARTAITRFAPIFSSKPLIIVGLYASTLREAFANDPIPRFDHTHAIYIDRGSPTQILDRLKGTSVPVNAPTKRRAYRTDRAQLAPLHRYRTIQLAGVDLRGGYVETSTGCRHRCRHCPVSAVWNGRIAINDHDAVLDDVTWQIEAGAEHLSFGDPDFLNAPRHSVELLHEIHRRFPTVTLDITTKISEIVAHPDLWKELSASNLLFVISAIESMSEAVLTHLDKGHSASDVYSARDLLFDAGIGLHPTFLPFTPWSRVDDLVAIADFIWESHLESVVEPIQLTIELLTPPNSLLLPDPESFGAYDLARMGHTPRYRDPRLPQLQRLLTADATEGARTDEPFASTFKRMYRHICDAAEQPHRTTRLLLSTPPAATVSEPWFCCAAPIG
ncbi:MAG: radical SAM protein [Ferrimicrobium sp.]